MAIPPNGPVGQKEQGVIEIDDMEEYDELAESRANSQLKLTFRVLGMNGNKIDRRSKFSASSRWLAHLSRGLVE